MNAVKRREIFARLQAANPKPTTELEYETPFQLLIAVLLSAQATDKSVNLATRKFFPRHGTPQAMLELGEEGLAEYIKTIGLYRTKAKNAIATCRLLLERHGGEVPQSREALEALPGVGRKTANVVLNTAFGEATIAVDTHIFRVSNRTGIAPARTCWRSSASWRRWCRASTCWMPTIGSSCMAATCAWRASPNARSAASRTCANTS